MTKIFTDEDGRKYELKANIAELNFLEQGSLVIKPLKEEKQTYCLDFYTGMPQEMIWEHGYDLTPDQAKAVSEAIEALMEYVTIPPTNNDEVELIDMADKARESLNNE